ncbi:4Fe-4S dicluster domain-containing protein [Adlercreutzia sp. ZJ141]|uniref:4Fe-4S dicluster domain-containing protein n=1 Tax=Adlercreutzia sp. ZJ141 TaxID=2709406 RepID=UPI0013EAEA33|nr:4Fe-4S dicluster domain-containing protein [Adlercreutzia sp. ZJ141]
MRFGMAIDTSRCIGCHTCAVACKMSNNLPNDVWWNHIKTDGGKSIDTARGTYPDNLYQVYYPINCQHCSKPVCVSVCPTGASIQREDGIVVVDSEKCIGCGSCVTACPYDVRVLYEEELNYSVDFAVGDSDAPKHVSGVMGKCNGCAHRVDRGEAPACMELCPARARYWGDLDDPESDVSKYLEGKKTERLFESEGTEPNVFYVL